MLQFLETGKAIYIMLAICAGGIISKWITGRLYKRLIKQSDNMTTTKNKFLKQLRQKVENTYRLNVDVNNVPALVEKQLVQYHFLGLSLRGWNNLSGQATLWSFFLGGLGALGSYWFGALPATIVLYGAAGVLLGILNILVENVSDIEGKRQKLLLYLEDYVENSLFNRLSKEHMSIEEEEIDVEDDIDEPAFMEKEESKRDIEYLRRSLDQIAAGREKTRRQEEKQRHLGPEEEKLIEEIIKEYLS